MKRASPFWLALFLLKYFLVLRLDILLQLLRLYWQCKLHPERGAFVFDAEISADFGIVFILD